MLLIDMYDVLSRENVRVSYKVIFIQETIRYYQEISEKGMKISRVITKGISWCYNQG